MRGWLPLRSTIAACDRQAAVCSATGAAWSQQLESLVCWVALRCLNVECSAGIRIICALFVEYWYDLCSLSEFWFSLGHLVTWVAFL